MRVYLSGDSGSGASRRDQGTPVLTRVRVATSFFERLTGLIFKSELSGDEGLLFEGCSSIHTLWMRFPIDAVFLCEKNRILRIFHHLKPFCVTPAVKNSKKVLELKAGAASELGLEKGDILEFIG